MFTLMKTAATSMALAMACSVCLFAQEETRSEEPLPAPETPEDVEVTARADDLVGIATSGSEGVTGKEDLARRPLLRPGELVETVPGTIATQHSGGGKGNQYFLRGFNLDHGTDFHVTLDGMQVNLPTHAHGQGYADLNFVIPELVERARFRKGPYWAEVGDFSAAGSVDFDLVRALDRPIVDLVAGTDDYARALAAGSLPIGEGTVLGAVEFSHYDGPWERPDDFRRWNGVVRWTRGEADRGLTVTAMAYDGEWDATDQIPRRAVEQGLVGRFGSLDDDLGGESGRYSLSASWRTRNVGSTTTLSGYVLRYSLDLLSNFTYFLDDPAEGDEFLQRDRRTALGARFARGYVAGPGGRAVRWNWGLDARADFIDNGLFDTAGGAIRDTVRADDVEQLLGAAFVDAEIEWNAWFRTRAGLRADVFRADVSSDLAENSGSRSDSLLSPKLSLVFGPWSRTEVYVNLGAGYHSNDARGATIRVDPRSGEPAEPVDPLVRATGADVGFRTSALDGLQTSVTFFVLELDSELLFVGDAGGTEASRPSRRTGVEIANHWRPAPWLTLELDAAWTRGRFTDDDSAGEFIPGALTSAVSAGAAFDSPRGFFGAIRWRYFGPRPLIEDGSVRSGSTSLASLRAGWRFARDVSLAVEVFNLFDRDDSDIEYFYASRLPGEPEEGVEDVHFHPMESRSVRLVTKWGW